MTRKEYGDMSAAWLLRERPPTGPAPRPADCPPEGDPLRGLADSVEDMADPDAISRDIRKTALLSMMAEWDAADEAGRGELAARAVRAALRQDQRLGGGDDGAKEEDGHA